MANTFLTGGTDYLTLDVGDTSPTTSDTNFNLVIHTNNTPFATDVHTTTDTEETTITNTTTETLTPVDDLEKRSESVTFETIYKNLASYPYDLNMEDDTYIIKDFYLPNDGHIQVIIDSREENKIVTSIYGDTGFDEPLIKETIIDGDNITTTYRGG